MSIQYAPCMEHPKVNVLADLLIENDSFLLAMLGAEARRRFTEALEQWGLSRQGHGVIFSLYLIASAVSQKQLAGFVGIDSRNLVSVIDTLEKRGLVQRVSNPTDRREHQIQLTAQGEVIAKQLHDVHATAEKTAFASLSKNEKQTLHGLLLKLWEHARVLQSPRAHED